ncbi:hypothetical protein CO656_15880 [Sinorhizobium sp. FG01]|uniref:Uncharacterized protein n=2 Tax=Sinorhizobium TaxID=28105 RepID=A0A2S3YI09_9HYPH|nr:hypothetical protein NXT3_CH00758 [Sinorhizobium fredii]PDT40794.1 hypothetical protein CO656_15880 [Sinorhizobium sp. FG01]POH26393.1 hypothetical protein ATY31_25575 [Sinorhizobium americanum]
MAPSLIGARVSSPQAIAPVTFATEGWTLRLYFENSNCPQVSFSQPRSDAMMTMKKIDVAAIEAA